MTHSVGTVPEAWNALRCVAASLRSKQSLSPAQADWLASAIENCKGDSTAQLVRELGLVMRGRRRTVNPAAVSIRVEELVKGGNSIMAACEQAGEELGCPTKTAHRLYKQGRGAGFDGRRT